MERIAHRKETKDNADLYYKVNRDLAIEAAQKAQKSGVGQFVILSSVSVYGLTCGEITKNTKENPVTNYGKSKYQADVEILKMQNEYFKVCILRPPMVYGKGCKGNYQTLRKFAMRSPVFPSMNNQRSMIYISNLAAFVERMIREKRSGIFFPQNQEYVSTTEMVKEISKVQERKIHFIKLFNWSIKLAIVCKINVFRKVFGNLIYEKVDLCNEVGFHESIVETES